jgi:hypothetical protein
VQFGRDARERGQALGPFRYGYAAAISGRATQPLRV